MVITVIECSSTFGNGLKHIQTITRSSRAFNHSDGGSHPTILQSAKKRKFQCMWLLCISNQLQ